IGNGPMDDVPSGRSSPAPPVQAGSFLLRVRHASSGVALGRQRPRVRRWARPSSLICWLHLGVVLWADVPLVAVGPTPFGGMGRYPFIKGLLSGRLEHHRHADLPSALVA